jgi:hypothetical protein
MKASTHTTLGLCTFERGGLTSSLDSSATAVARFAYCEHCDRVAPVDVDDNCTYCFNPVPDEDWE